MIAEKRISAAVELVRAALGYHVYGGARSEPKLSPEGVPIHLKLLHRFHADVGGAQLSRAKFILSAVDGHQVVAPVAAADRKARSEKAGVTRILCARRIRARHAR